ncbi:uncharacterized protein LOC133314519 [Gastrolobium bilobum]|uniref:uncharacterized protein LOC133309546 n=1 Tax=Gastrolobium bilobum TaxID=150636 RepID=UPI002AB1961D|nr:uncharacterized protein LOC133309546 [Gastrolobium bilobum]XP_061371988.1 uncharacterized protein LOC133314519 [Gastrolobium bilobum]
MAENHVQPPQRTLGDYMNPAVIPPIGSVVRPTVESNNFELKPALVHLVQKEQFAGTSAEDPYLHIENFLLLSDTVKINEVSRDAILLRLFTHSLKDDARRWLQSLPQGSITTWDDLQTKFLARFFSASKRAKLKDEIIGFKKKELESIYEAWERFKTLLRKSGGSLTTKTPQEALDIFESLASQEFDNAPVNERRMGIIKLDGYDALLAKNDQMQQVQKQQQQQIDSLTKQLSSHKVASVDTNSVSASCEKSHVTDDCDCGRPAEQAEVNGVWYDHNNQSNYNNQGRNINQEASIQNLETQIGQLSRQIAERPQGKFPGDTMVNPKEHCKSIITRSGLVLQPVNKKVDEKKVGEKKSEEEVIVEDVVVENDKEEEVEEKKKEEEVVVEKSSSPKKLMKWEKKKMADKQDQPINLSFYAKVPYPQRLKQEIQKQHYARFLDIFKKLQINIPFVEAWRTCLIMPNL